MGVVVNLWLFEQINAFARATPWLHAAARLYAGLGVIVFAALLLAGWWIARRTAVVSRVAAAIAAGGATMAGAVAVGLWIVHRRLGIVAAMAAVLMAFTRVYIAAHYPADVAAGLLLGGVVAA